MKKGMKKILSAAIVLAMTMSLAACGGGTKETQGQASSETAAASGESAGTEAGETSVGEIKRGGTLTLRRTGTTPINPTQVIAPAGDMMTYSLFFETLTWFNEEDYSAQPSLAESWEWSDDSLSLTMKLKEEASISLTALRSMQKQLRQLWNTTWIRILPMHRQVIWPMLIM